MGLGDFLKNIGNYAVEKYNDKVDEVNVIAERMQYRSERELFEIVYRYSKPGNIHPFNSEGMAARKVLHDMGYENEEIGERIKQMYRERGR